MNQAAYIKYFFFPIGYFKVFTKLLNTKQFDVIFDNIVIALALSIQHNNNFHYHLSASDSEYFHLRPNHFITWNLIKYAKDNGFKYLSIGGGRTSAKDDLLFRFKKGFSSLIADFYIGKKIHYEKIYNEVIRQWK